MKVFLKILDDGEPQFIAEQNMQVSCSGVCLCLCLVYMHIWKTVFCLQIVHTLSALLPPINAPPPPPPPPPSPIYDVAHHLEIWSVVYIKCPLLCAFSICVKCYWRFCIAFLAMTTWRNLWSPYCLLCFGCWGWVMVIKCFVFVSFHCVLSDPISHGDKLFCDHAIPVCYHVIPVCSSQIRHLMVINLLMIMSFQRVLTEPTSHEKIFVLLQNVIMLVLCYEDHKDMCIQLLLKVLWGVYDWPVGKQVCMLNWKRALLCSIIWGTEGEKMWSEKHFVCLGIICTSRLTGVFVFGVWSLFWLAEEMITFYVWF